MSHAMVHRFSVSKFLISNIQTWNLQFFLPLALMELGIFPISMEIGICNLRLEEKMENEIYSCFN